MSAAPNPNCAQSPVKFYVITSPCVGKTRTTRRFPQYGDLLLIDHNDLTARMLQDGEITIKNSEADKARAFLVYLESLNRPACLLGCYMPDHPGHYPSVRFVGVILPKSLHYWYTLKRRIRSTLARIWDGVPILDSFRPTDPWQRWRNTAAHRDRVRAFVHHHQLPMFPTLGDALSRLRHLQESWNTPSRGTGTRS